MEIIGEFDEEQGDIWGFNDQENSVAACISIQALSGCKSYQAMRIVGFAQRKPLHILMDTGSTHNFLDLDYAKSLGCIMEPIQPQSIKVADGNNIPCKFKCENFVWSINGHEFRNKVLLINIGSYDMVLGIEWFKQWGEINWDFNNMIMKFYVHGKPICLKGVIHSNNSCFVDGTVKREKATRCN